MTTLCADAMRGAAQLVFVIGVGVGAVVMWGVVAIGLLLFPRRRSR